MKPGEGLWKTASEAATTFKIYVPDPTAQQIGFIGVMKEEKALQASKFKPECAGKTVSVVFRYQLHGQPSASPKVTSKTEDPNLVWIESEPAAGAKGAVPTKK